MLYGVIGNLNIHQSGSEKRFLKTQINRTTSGLSVKLILVLSERAEVYRLNADKPKYTDPITTQNWTGSRRKKESTINFTKCSKIFVKIYQIVFLFVNV